MRCGLGGSTIFEQIVEDIRQGNGIGFRAWFHRLE